MKALVTAISLLGLAGPAHARPPVIFGDDNRKDITEIQDAQMLRLADAAVYLFRKEALIPGTAGRSVLRLENYGTKYKVCPDERFVNQGSGAGFSGVLVGPDLVLTAAHAMRGPEDCAAHLIAFGFNSAAVPEGTVRDRDLYSCTAIVAREKSGAKGDFAVIRLDRPVLDHRPAEVNREEDLTASAPLAVMGHPNGLPLKLADGAHLRQAQGAFFEANTDTFVGNSGSPIFNLRTGKIEGILVDGEEPDFTYDPQAGCNRPTRCPEDGCGSEVATAAQDFAAFIPPLK
jgi:hypothetical protein